MGRTKSAQATGKEKVAGFEDFGSLHPSGNL